LSRRQSLKTHIILPDTNNFFIRELIGWVDALRDDFSPYGLVPDTVIVPELDPLALAQAIRDLSNETDGLAILALDHPAVQDAIDETVASGKPVVTLVSDVPTSKRHIY